MARGHFHLNPLLWGCQVPNTSMPEGNTAQPFDGEQRSWFKLASLLYESVGNRGGPWPEGTQPFVFENEQRLEQKVNKMLE